MAEGIDTASDQTEITLLEDAPETLKRSLHDITRGQDLNRRTVDAYWETNTWEQEDEY